MPRRALFLLVVLAALLQLAAAQGVPAAPTDVVWLSQTGTKYHRKTCRTLKLPPTETTREKAEKMGRGACKVCRP